MLRLGIISATQSPARTGAPVAQWVELLAAAHGGFDVDPIGLREVNLPFYDEPRLPRLGGYVHEHTQQWSRRIAACDGFIVVSPEYNHSYPAILKNAFDFLHVEWAAKPLGIVSYGGGVSAGLRGAEALRGLAATLQMYTLAEQVMVPFVSHYVVDGQFAPSDDMAAGAAAMLDALARVGESMRAYRQRTAAE